MSRSLRMFEIIQHLRQARQPVTAQYLADELEVTKRTVYRDIAALQARRVPVEGEAGIGYVLRRGFDLPPLMFTHEELDAVTTGLALLGRTGDSTLTAAAQRAAQKIRGVVPDSDRSALTDGSIFTSTSHSIPPTIVDPQFLRQCIHASEKLNIRYSDSQADGTERVILPLAMIFYIESIVVAAWCELREGYRHFRVDRIIEATATGENFSAQAPVLRENWRQQIEHQSVSSA